MKKKITIITISLIILLILGISFSTISNAAIEVKAGTTPHTSIEDTLQTMSQNQIRRMPVISDSGLVGMLSIGDIANSDYINSKDVGQTIENICSCNHNSKNAE